jgi:hypothetical protein
VSADRLQPIGWGKVRRNYPERGPIGTEWVDASKVVAVRHASDDRDFREQSYLELRSGQTMVVFGTPDEVVTQLNGGTPS